jgi:hypothetical protein
MTQTSKLQGLSLRDNNKKVEARSSRATQGSFRSNSGE